MYSPATSKLKNVLKHVVYSTLKSKSMVFYHRYLTICILFDFTNSLPINLIKVAIWWWNFLFYVVSPLFIEGLLFTLTTSTGWIFYPVQWLIALYLYIQILDPNSISNLGYKCLIKPYCKLWVARIKCAGNALITASLVEYQWQWLSTPQGRH